MQKEIKFVDVLMFSKGNTPCTNLKMRIRDTARRKHEARAVTYITSISRSRAARTSVKVTTAFMRELNYELEEQKLLDDQLHEMKASTFDLDKHSDRECLQKFRFKKVDLYRLQSIVQWPIEKNTTKRRRYKTNFIFSFCLMCRRLGTAGRWCSLVKEFGRSEGVLNEIFYESLEYFYETYAHLITTFRDEFVQSRAEIYSNAIEKCGAPYDKCVGFIDGTNIFIARPRGLQQRATFSGHKRRNGLKFQAISAPDGLILHIYGPMEARRHDMTLFRHSNIGTELERALRIKQTQYNIYGDSAYV